MKLRTTLDNAEKMLHIVNKNNSNIIYLRAFVPVIYFMVVT